jgi:PIN domain nuclease of toxin-antitoxin system
MSYLMNESYVIDTHALYFYLTETGKIKASVDDIFNRFDNNSVTFIISWIVIAELYWLVKKRSPQMDFNAEFQKFYEHPNTIFIGLDADQVLNLSNFEKVTEMHDRIIVGVAHKLNIPIITKDQNMIESGYVTTIWN